MQSVNITTNVMSSNPDHGQVYSTQHYVIKYILFGKNHCSCSQTSAIRGRPFNTWGCVFPLHGYLFLICNQFENVKIDFYQIVYTLSHNQFHITYNIHIFVSGNRTRPNLYGFAYPKISSSCCRKCQLTRSLI
jgi:hypothetical protein